MENFLKEIKNKILIYDGSKGYMLQKLGMKGGECPELWNVEHSEEVKQIYNAYKQAGSDIIQTNTFQGNRLKLEEYSLEDRTYELNYEGTRLAKEVMRKDGWVAASIGPIGKLFEPSGELTFEIAYNVYKEQVKAVADGGADIINFETFTDLAEMRPALLAAKETTHLPIICSVAFEANGKTLMGTDPFTAGIVLKSLGADMIGTNCSFGPDHLLEIVKQMSKVGGISLCAKPNAGLPQMIDGNTVYNESPERFAAIASNFVQYNVRLIGGCCGTTPEFIEAVKKSMAGIKVQKIMSKSEQLITSGVKTLNLENSNSLNIGYLYADTDKQLIVELSKENMDYITDLALELASDGYDAIYINIDKAKCDNAVLAQVVNVAQGYIREPFIIETQNKDALNKALRIYKGKAGIVIDGYNNTILEELLFEAQKYGSTVVNRKLIIK